MSGDATGDDAMLVLPSPPTAKATADRFTGEVWVDGITSGAGAGTATLATVRFSPGARTAWHRHTNGQTLHVTDGRGIVQSRDGQTIAMRPGDTVYTPPGVWHWHGAASDSFMMHLALSLAGGEVDWGEHVSDDEYAAAHSWPRRTSIEKERPMTDIDIMADAGPVHHYRDNPFGLVYEYPITENVPGQVNIHPVSYTLRDLTIVANVYTPAGYDPNGSYPAITVAHPNGGTKEQAAGRYAQRLAEQGYVTITADAAYQGHSGGVPRNVDKPFYRTDDIHGMADFITTFPGVDAGRLGALGICGDGGYTLNAVKSDKRFKAVATVSMFNSGAVRRNGMQNSAVDAIQDKLRQASEARAQEAAGGEVRYAGDADLTDEQIAAQPFPLYREGYVYYWKTHACPGSTFKYTMSSLLDLMAWDATDQLELIDVPLLMIAGSEADTRYMSDEAFPLATGTDDKELFLIEGAQHIETYWVDEYVDAALDTLAAFYARTVS